MRSNCAGEHLLLIENNNNNNNKPPSSIIVDSHSDFFGITMAPNHPQQSNGVNNTFQVSEFGSLQQIGVGQYGLVYKTIHIPSQRIMAIKKVLSTRECYNELNYFWDFLLDPNASSRQDEGREYIVDYFGTIFFDSDCWLCMELMDLSLDKFVEFVYSLPDGHVPEFVVAQIARTMVLALNFLETNSYKLRRKSYGNRELQLKQADGESNTSNNNNTTTISTTTLNGFVNNNNNSTPFADVKTSNILISRTGLIKLCDLGMCRRLIDPTASSQGGEWYHYIAPERICPGPGSQQMSDQFDVRTDSRADVWGIGISLYEISAGVLPFHDVKLAFQVIAAIVNGPSPKLEPINDRRSPDLTSFVNYCLTKNVGERPNYQDLLAHDFVAKASSERDVAKLASYFSMVLKLNDERQQQENVMMEANRRRGVPMSSKNKASNSSNTTTSASGVTLSVS